MKKLLIIYRSGTQTTIEYDEEKCDVFDELKTSFSADQLSRVCKVSDEKHFLIRVDQIDHMEVLK